MLDCLFLNVYYSSTLTPYNMIYTKIAPFSAVLGDTIIKAGRELKALAIENDVYIKQDGDCTFPECAGVYEEETVNVGEFDEYRPAKALVCDECGDVQLLEPDGECGHDQVMYNN